MGVLRGEFDELAEHLVAHLGLFDGLIQDALRNIHRLGLGEFLLVDCVCVPSVSGDECGDCGGIFGH